MLVTVWVVALIGAAVQAHALGNGVNLQPSYYNGGNVSFGWDLMRSYPQIKSVRIEIEPDKAVPAWNWIRDASSRGYSVIAAYHKCAVLGTDDSEELLAAASWWVSNYKYLSSAGEFVVNLMNEWGSHSQTPDSYSKAYNAAIQKVRTVYSGNIIIDIPGWGQETQTAASAGPMIADPRVWMSAHVYQQGWNQAAGRYLLPSDMDVLASSGKPFLVGEYGTVSSEGPVDVIAVVNRAKQLGSKGVLAWAWNGDGGTLNMVAPSWAKNPTSSSYSVSEYFGNVIGPI